MADPAWLGNAQGDLITAAIIGLPVPAWKMRAHWIGKLMGITWFGCACVFAYYTVGGWTSPVAVFFGLRPPLWMPFWAGVIVGVLATLTARRVPRTQAGGPAPPVEKARTPPAPETSTDPSAEDQILALSPEDRALLAMLSVRPGFAATVEDCVPPDAGDRQARLNDILAILEVEHVFIEQCGDWPEDRTLRLREWVRPIVAKLRRERRLG